MSKIKKLRSKHRFIRWVKKLLGIQAPSLAWFRDIDEVHLFHNVVHEPVRLTVEVTDWKLDGLPLTKAEAKCRIQRVLAERLTREIIEKELYRLTVTDDQANGQTRYSATLLVYAQAKETEQ